MRCRIWLQCECLVIGNIEEPPGPVDSIIVRMEDHGERLFNIDTHISTVNFGAIIVARNRGGAPFAISHRYYAHNFYGTPVRRYVLCSFRVYLKHCSGEQCKSWLIKQVAFICAPSCRMFFFMLVGGVQLTRSVSGLSSYMCELLTQNSNSNGRVSECHRREIIAGPASVVIYNWDSWHFAKTAARAPAEWESTQVKYSLSPTRAPDGKYAILLRARMC